MTEVMQIIAALNRQGITGESEVLECLRICLLLTQARTALQAHPDLKETPHGRKTVFRR